MNRAELINALEEKTGMNRKDCDKILRAFVDLTTDTLKNGGEVFIKGFGTFSVKSYPARNGVKVKTGEKISIPPRRRPIFKAGKYLKESV